MSKPCKLGIIVGRFQTLHKGHVQIMKRAAELCDELGIFIGSSQEAGTEKNPFSYEKRKELIETVMGDAVRIYPLPDIGVGNCAGWGDYVLENVRKRFGKAPDVFISGREARRVSWLSDVHKENIAEIYIQKEIDISGSAMRRFMLEGDRASWERYAPEKLRGRYEELRDIVLKAQGRRETSSL